PNSLSGFGVPPITAAPATGAATARHAAAAITRPLTLMSRPQFVFRDRRRRPGAAQLAGRGGGRALRAVSAVYEVFAPEVNPGPVSLLSRPRVGGRRPSAARS